MEKLNIKEPLTISVIVPVLNEAGRIPKLLHQLRSLQPFEWWIVDGGSSDETVDLAGECTDRILTTTDGLAAQLNLGGEKAKGKVLFFVHADTKLPEEPLLSIQHALKDPNVAGGGFRLMIDSDRWILKIISRLANLRAKFLKAPLGDQGIFVRKKVFQKMGGFRSDVLLEDLDFSLRMKKEGQVVLLKELVRTSPRKWERYGIFRTTLSHLYFLFRHFLLSDPGKLKKRYKSFKDRAR